MTFTEAAAEVLRVVGRPLHYKEITALAIEKNLLSHVGKSPEVTMGSRLAALFKKPDEENPMLRIRPGVFALREWETSGQLKQMLAKAKTAAKTAERDEAAAQHPAEEPAEVAPAEAPAAPAPETTAAPEPVAPPVEEPEPITQPRPAAPASTPEPMVQATVEDVQPAPAPSPAPLPSVSLEPDEEAAEEPVIDAEHAARAELAAGASGVFEEEDDDDRPILGPDAGPGDREGGRRRRRRRRRGKGGLEGGNGVAYSATPLPPDFDASDLSTVEARPPAQPSPGPHPVVLEVGSAALDNLALDDFGGKDMADAIAIVLSSFDRAAGPVSLRQIADSAQKRGRLSGDVQQLQSQIAASVRADNMRRVASGLRPRFRFVAGRIALTDWLLSAELSRLEQEAHAAVDRYRDAARKAFARKLQELPGHAFVELTLLALERIGFHHVRAMRRAGIPGNEAHFTAVHDTGAADVVSALVIRRDGREIGRERVTELRGSLHHYGPAAVGWIVTAGPVLSGAREEAGATHTNPIVVLDGLGLARLCEQNDVAVLRSSLPIAIPDLDMLEALRAS